MGVDVTARQYIAILHMCVYTRKLGWDQQCQPHQDAIQSPTAYQSSNINAISPITRYTSSKKDQQIAHQYYRSSSKARPSPDLVGHTCFISCLPRAPMVVHEDMSLGTYTTHYGVCPCLLQVEVAGIRVIIVLGSQFWDLLANSLLLDASYILL